MPSFGSAAVAPVRTPHRYWVLAAARSRVSARNRSTPATLISKRQCLLISTSRRSRRGCGASLRIFCRAAQADAMKEPDLSGLEIRTLRAETLAGADRERVFALFDLAYRDANHAYL